MTAALDSLPNLEMSSLQLWGVRVVAADPPILAAAARGCLFRQLVFLLGRFVCTVVANCVVSRPTACSHAEALGSH